MSTGTIITKDGTTIFYKDWSTGQPIAFSHGWPLIHCSWKLPSAMQMIMAEYGKGGISEQELLAPLLEILEPGVQAFFIEEIEDQQHVFYFDGYEATIKHIQMTASKIV